MPELLAREFVGVAAELPDAVGAVVLVRPTTAATRAWWRLAAWTRAQAAAAASVVAHGGSAVADGVLVTEGLGVDADGPRTAAVVFAGGPERAHEPPAQDDRGRRATGLRACASRANVPRRLAASQGIARSSCCSPGSSAPAPRCRGWPTRSSGSRGTRLTVLITGESGTGKDLVARAIHAGSPRADNVYLPFNCTTTTRELADSQLFGHRRGSFTGAVTDQPGIIRSRRRRHAVPRRDRRHPARRAAQAAALSGAGRDHPGRRAAADLGGRARAGRDQRRPRAARGRGRFREDLYYRLSIIRIDVPPLRERREEIPHLCTFFLRDSSERLDKPDVQLSSAALDVLTQYWWPGNVRQLRNEIQRAVAMSPPGGMLEPEHFSA